MHALLDHKLDIDAIGKIINQAEPVMFGSRFQYEAQFKVRGYTPIRAFVRVEPGPMKEDGAPDDLQMGVVTGYCKTGSEAGEGKCEDWVNDTLGNGLP